MAAIPHQATLGRSPANRVPHTADGHSNAFLVFAAVTYGLLCANSATASDLTVIGPTPVTISSDTTFDNVTVTGTGVLIVDAILTVNVNMTIQSDGKVTHGAADTTGLVLNVTGTLTVDAGGAINVNGVGLRGGNNGSRFGQEGEGIDPLCAP